MIRIWLPECGRIMRTTTGFKATDGMIDHPRSKAQRLGIRAFAVLLLHFSFEHVYTPNINERLLKFKPLHDSHVDEDVSFAQGCKQHFHQLAADQMTLIDTRRLMYKQARHLRNLFTSNGVSVPALLKEALMEQRVAGGREDGQPQEGGGSLEGFDAIQAGNNYYQKLLVYADAVKGVLEELETLLTNNERIKCDNVRLTAALSDAEARLDRKIPAWRVQSGYETEPAPRNYLMLLTASTMLNAALGGDVLNDPDAPDTPPSPLNAAQHDPPVRSPAIGFEHLSSEGLDDIQAVVSSPTTSPTAPARDLTNEQTMNSGYSPALFTTTGLVVLCACPTPVKTKDPTLIFLCVNEYAPHTLLDANERMQNFETIHNAHVEDAATFLRRTKSLFLDLSAEHLHLTDVQRIVLKNMRHVRSVFVNNSLPTPDLVTAALREQRVAGGVDLDREGDRLDVTSTNASYHASLTPYAAAVDQVNQMINGLGDENLREKLEIEKLAAILQSAEIVLDKKLPNWRADHPYPRSGAQGLYPHPRSWLPERRRCFGCPPGE
ncbi:unnamed protein product, partial [Mesorhabditis spiculigera]